MFFWKYLKSDSEKPPIKLEAANAWKIKSTEVLVKWIEIKCWYIIKYVISLQLLCNFLKNNWMLLMPLITKHPVISGITLHADRFRIKTPPQCVRFRDDALRRRIIVPASPSICLRFAFNQRRSAKARKSSSHCRSDTKPLFVTKATAVPMKRDDGWGFDSATVP